MERLCREYAELLNSDKPGWNGFGIYGRESEKIENIQV